MLIEIERIEQVVGKRVSAGQRGHSVRCVYESDSSIMKMLHAELLGSMILGDVSRDTDEFSSKTNGPTMRMVVEGLTES